MTAPGLKAILRLVAASALIGSTALTACGQAGESDAGRPAAGIPAADLDRARQKPVLFVPLELAAERLPLKELARQFRHEQGLTIKILPHIQLPDRAVDIARAQLIGDEAMDALRRRYLGRPGNRDATVVGITAQDLYTTDEPWAFAFAVGEAGVIVVSGARMNPTFFGEAPEPGLLRTRLHKMILRNLGRCHFGLPPSTDRRSVLYGEIMGLPDLDALGDRLFVSGEGETA